MRTKIALSAAVASMLFAVPVFAAPEVPSNTQAPYDGHGGKHHRKHKGMERRLHRAVEDGRLTQAQADQFLAEAQQLREEMRAQRQAGGCQLNPDQKQQFKQRKQALREKVRTALMASRPQ